MKRILAIAGLFLSIAPFISAKIILPNILDDHMVLQQQTSVKLWGKTDAEKRVTVKPSWTKKAYSCQAGKDGKWIVEIKTPSAGGPYDIQISDGEKLTLHDVLIGEVWLCSGQSNMEMPMKGFASQPVEGANDFIAKANETTPIRMYTAKISHHYIPQDNVSGQWMVHTSEYIPQWSATAYFFGKYLQETLNVPIGLVVSSWGGSKVEAWMSQEAFTDFPEYDISFLKTGTKPATRENHTPCLLYNAMIHPLINFTIKGCIWYQGEANIDNYKTYEYLMPAFVKNWRMKWGYEFPFYYAQIAPFAYKDAEGINAALLREVQLKHMKAIPNSGMVVTIDIGDKHCIHPAKKQEVGKRFAYWALAKTYGRKEIGFCAPTYKSINITGNKVYVNFDKVSSKHIAPLGVHFNCVEVAGKDRIFYQANAYIDHKTGCLVACSDKVSLPVAIRYGFKNYVKGDIFDEFGLPVPPFRSDDW